MLKLCDIAAKPLASFIRAPFLISKILTTKLLSNFLVLPKYEYYASTLCFKIYNISIMLVSCATFYLILITHDYLGCQIS